MELAIKATCAETIQFSLLYELSPFCVIKILTRPVGLRPAVGPTLNMSRTVLIWPSRPQSSHIGSTCKRPNLNMPNEKAQTCRSTYQADRRKCLNMPKSNMPKHAERRNMAERPHLCMQTTKLKHAKRKSSNMPKHVPSRQKKVLKHAKTKHAEARGKKKHPPIGTCSAYQQQAKL